MLITVDRFISDSDTTISRVFVDRQFVCFGLEDEFREDKIPAETRIPAGRYDVGVRTVGGFHAKYTKRYGSMHRGMLHILDVPNFEFILIHTGNTDEHTAGCLLVGMTADTNPGDMKIGASRVAYKKLYPMVIEAAENGDLHIEYQDNDRPSV